MAQNLLNQIVARGAQAQLHSELDTIRPLFADFANAALKADESKARLGKTSDGSGAVGAVWPKARAIMLAVAEHKIDPTRWNTIVTSLMQEYKIEKSSTAKSYRSTLVRFPYIAQSPEGVAAHGGKPIELDKMAYNGVREVMKQANLIALQSTREGPAMLKYAKVCEEIGDRLRNLVKARKADSKKNLPALVAFTYEEALQHATAILGLIPERSEKAPETETEQPAGETEEDAEPMTRAA